MWHDGNGAQQARAAVTFCNQKPQEHAQGGSAPLRHPPTTLTLRKDKPARNEHPTYSDHRECV